MLISWFSNRPRARAAASSSFRPQVESLETRCQPSRLTPATAPILPTIASADRTFLRSVLNQGLRQGNRPNVFAKIGDSISASPYFLTELGSGYNPADASIAGAHTNLAATIHYFRAGPIDGKGSNSFNRQSVAAVPGYQSGHVLATIGTELSQIRPAIALIMVGTNDVFLSANPGPFRASLVAIVNQALSRGVIPVLSTIPDNYYANAAYLPRIRPFNQAIIDVAQQKRVPLWNYWRALQTLPNHGVDAGGVHPNFYAHGSRYFTEEGLRFGYNMRNFTAVAVLEKLKRIVLSNGRPDLVGQRWTSTQGKSLLVIGRSSRNGPQITVLDAATRAALISFNPFPRSLGPVRVAAGDVNHDGISDIVAATGAGVRAQVKVYHGKNGVLLRSITPYGRQFRGGVYVAVGDVNGDSFADVITGAGRGSRIKVFSGRNGRVLRSFLAFGRGFQGGVRVAAGDVNRDGKADIVAGAGPGIRPLVRVFDGSSRRLLRTLVAYGRRFTGGVYVAAGDVNGDGRADILTGAGEGGPPHVRVFNGRTGKPVAGFFANDSRSRSGTRVAAVDFNRDNRADVATGSGPRAQPNVRLFNGRTRHLVDSLFASDPLFLDGVFVAGT